MPGAEDDFVIKDNLGILIDNSAEAIEADPKRKHMIIISVKEDFINAISLATAFMM